MGKPWANAATDSLSDGTSDGTASDLGADQRAHVSDTFADVLSKPANWKPHRMPVHNTYCSTDRLANQETRLVSRQLSLGSRQTEV